MVHLIAQSKIKFKFKIKFPPVLETECVNYYKLYKKFKGKLGAIKHGSKLNVTHLRAASCAWILRSRKDLEKLFFYIAHIFEQSSENLFYMNLTGNVPNKVQYKMKTVTKAIIHAPELLKMM